MAIDGVQMSSVRDAGIRESGYGKPQSLTELAPQSDLRAKSPRTKEAETPFGKAAVIELSGHAKEFLARLEGRVQRREDLSLDKLSPQERHKAEGLYRELDDIFGARHRRALDADESLRINRLTASINQIRGLISEPVSGDRAVQVEQLEREVDHLLADPDRLLTRTEEGRLAQLLGQIESLHGIGSIPFAVADEHRDQVTEIEREIDGIQGVMIPSPPTSRQLDRAEGIFDQLRTVFDTAFKRLSESNKPAPAQASEKAPEQASHESLRVSV